MWLFNNHSLPVSSVVKRDLRHGYLKAELGCGLCGLFRVEANAEAEILEGGFWH